MSLPHDPKPRKGVALRMGQRKSGLSVPEEHVDDCKHLAVHKRVKQQVNQYVCEDCREKLLLVSLQAVLVTPEQWEELKRQLEAKAAAIKRRQAGIVLPGEPGSEVGTGEERSNDLPAEALQARRGPRGP